MTWNEWQGQSVLDLDTGTQIGTVFRLVADANLNAAEYLVVQARDSRQPLTILAFEKVLGKAPILIFGHQLEPLIPESPCWQNWTLPLPLGKVGIYPHQPSPGRCTDIQLDESGRFIGLIFDRKTHLPMDQVACMGQDAIILTPAEDAHDIPADLDLIAALPENSAPDPAPETGDNPSALIGRIVTQNISSPDGQALAREGQVIDQPLIEAAAKVQRRVALIVHSRPSSSVSSASDES